MEVTNKQETNLHEKTRRGRALIAFMDENDAVSMMKGGPILEGEDVDEYRTKHRHAAENLHGIKRRVEQPEISEIDQSHKEYLTQVQQTPIFSQVFKNFSCSFKLVEIDKIVCFQRYVDTDYCYQLAFSLPKDANEIDVMKFCLPTAFPVNVSVNIDPPTQSITISSHLPNLFVAAPVVNPPGPNSPMTATFTFGVNANYVQIVNYNGHHLLKNGYHRVYALRQRGFTHTPCVYYEVSDYGQTGAERPGFFPRDLVLSECPPLFADFLDDRLSSEIRIQPTRKIIRIKAEQFGIPL